MSLSYLIQLSDTPPVLYLVILKYVSRKGIYIWFLKNLNESKLQTEHNNTPRLSDGYFAMSVSLYFNT